MLRASKGLSLEYQPADSQFPAGALIRKKRCVITARPRIQHRELTGVWQIASPYKPQTEEPGAGA